jgi:hypothetical protein
LPKISQQRTAGPINGCRQRRVRIGLTTSRIVIIGNYTLRRAKQLKIEVVVPKEEEERLTTEAPRGGHKYTENFGRKS